jgi:hypothetical protein
MYVRQGASATLNWVPLMKEMRTTWEREYLDFWPHTHPLRISYPPEFGALVQSIALKNFLAIQAQMQEQSQRPCSPEEQSFRRAQVFFPQCIQALKDLFEPTAFRYLQNVVAHPYFSEKLRQCDPDLFARLPGERDNALRNVSLLHHRIERGDLIRDPEILSVLSSFERDLQAIVNENEEGLFAQTGVLPRPPGSICRGLCDMVVAATAVLVMAVATCGLNYLIRRE